MSDKIDTYNKSSLVIIDGPKGAGKSSISQALVRHLNSNDVPAEYHKHIRSSVDEFSSMIGLVNDKSNNGIITVVDRLCWTEWVMGIYTGRVDSPTLTHQCRLVDELIRTQNAIHIFLLPKVETLQARLAGRPEEERRKVDMSWDVIHPLWRAAHGLSKGTLLWENEDEYARTCLINYILVRLNYNGKYFSSVA